MLRIGRKGKVVQIKVSLEEGWDDITSVSMWIGAVEKYKFDKVEANKQIELFISSLGVNIDDYNRGWYESYKKNNPLNL